MTHNIHVLVVEDEKPLAHALTLKLTAAGFTVATAEDGQQALDLIEKQHFDVVLLDLIMPVLDGFGVLEKLQKHRKKPYIIIISNLSQKIDEDRVLKLGAKKYYVKSDISLTDIVEEVKNSTQNRKEVL